MVTDPGICNNAVNGWEKQNTGNADAERALHQAGGNHLDKPLEIWFAGTQHKTDQHIENQENDFSDKEEIVCQRVDGNRGQKETAALFPEKQIQTHDKQRKEGHHIMKMVEQQIAALKSGKGVQHRAEKSAPAADIALKKQVGGQPGNGIFERKDSSQ